MSRRSHPDLHNTQIASTSYPVIRQLITEGRLIPIARGPESNNPVKGITGARLYTVAPSCPIIITSDIECIIGGHSIRANVYALPSPAYHAIVRANRFIQYPDLAELRANLQSSPADALAGLRRAVQQGRQPDQTVVVAQESAQFASTWLPERSVIQIKQLRGRDEPDMFLTLAFSSRFTGVFRPRRAAAMGLDVGLQPHTVVAHDNGHVRTFRLSPLVRLPYLSLSPAERELADILQYAQGREDSEEVVAYLIGHARHIYAEALNHRGMSPKYIARSRRLALQDAFFSHMSQYANTAGIPFTRVDAQRTSTTCPACDAQGERIKDTFRCTRCGLQRNAHEVGALNVVSRGLQGGSYLRTGQWR